MSTQNQIDTSPICPPAAATPQAKLAWLLGSRLRGESGLKNSESYKTIDQTIDIIAGRILQNLARDGKKSKLNVNIIKRQLREIVALLTQRIKPKWEYGTRNPLWEDHAHILTQRLKCWLDTNLFDRKLKEALQWAVCGAGYLTTGWSRPIPGFMDSDLDVSALGPDDVMRDQGMDLQRAYAVHIRRLYNLSEAVSRAPLSRNYLKPLRTRPTTRSQDSRKVTGWLSPLLNAINFPGTGGGGASSGDNVNSYGFLGTDIEVFYTYVLDPSLNTSGAEIHSDQITYDMMTGIKTKGTPWEYSVPFVGQQIQLDDNINNYTVATPDKCYLYPTRRLLIWTEDHLLYDGPSFYWHGRVPVIQFSLDKWPWEQISYSLAQGTISISDAVNQLLRGAIDMMNLKLDPPVMYNLREFTAKEMDKLDMRRPSARIGRSGMVPAADTITPILDGGYDIPVQLPGMVQNLLQMGNHDVGVADVTSLLELQQAPSADATERLLQAQGPLATDYARELEACITEFGYQAGWLFLEFDTAEKRLQLLGQGGITFADFDYKPGQLLPVDVPGVPNNATMMQKALIFGRHFVFNVVPNSIFEFTDTQDKLFKFQLWRDKTFPIDPWTLGEAWGLPNMGTPKGKNMVERWAEWKELSMKFEAKTMAEAQGVAQATLAEFQAQMMADPRMQMLMMLGSAMGGAPESGGGAPAPRGQNPNEGRPPTAQEPPRLENKGSLANPRNSTIAES